MQTKRGFKIFVMASVTLVLLGLFVARSAAFTCWDFRNNLWGPAYLLTHNQSPYRVDRLFDLGNAVWMPMTVGLFFPLGFLPLQQASNLWFIFNLIWLLLILWISSGSRRPPVFLFAVALLLTLVFPPTVTHLWSGQISILITLTFLVIAIWNEDMPLLLLAALMAVGLSKPQLAILVLPGFMVFRAKKYGIQKGILLLVYLIGSILLLALPLFLAYPNWFLDFVWAVQQNPSWAHPSSLHFLRNAVPNMGVIIWMILAIGIFILNIWLWTVRPSRDAMYWSLALTPLITPYIWTWDFVMLLPLFISSLFQAKKRISAGILLGGYILCWGLMTSMKIRGEVNDSLFWWVPWLLIASILGSGYLKSQTSPMRKQSSLLD